MFGNIIKFFILIFVISFFVLIFNYYTSVNNIDIIKSKRSNYNQDELLKINLPILNNNTDNVIEFNSGFNEELNSEPRKFWDLLKFK